MKRFIFLFSTLSVLTVFAGITAFNISKRTSIVTYYYTGANKCIGYGSNSIVTAELSNPFNWTNVLPSGYYITNGAYLAGIEFDEDVNGFYIAIDDIRWHYQIYGTLPTNNATFNEGFGDITIKRMLFN